MSLGLAVFFFFFFPPIISKKIRLWKRNLRAPLLCPRLEAGGEPPLRAKRWVLAAISSGNGWKWQGKSFPPCTLMDSSSHQLPQSPRPPPRRRTHRATSPRTFTYRDPSCGHREPSAVAHVARRRRWSMPRPVPALVTLNMGPPESSFPLRRPAVGFCDSRRS